MGMKTEDSKIPWLPRVYNKALALILGPGTKVAAQGRQLVRAFHVCRGK
jgi:hypothetical protein